MANERNTGGQLVTGLVLLAIVLIGIYFATRGGNDDENNNQENQNQEQQQEQNQGETPTPTPQPSNGDDTGDDVQGNVSVTGTLRESDNAARGNYMVESSRGKFYVSTSRDYSSRVGQEVTLQADGTVNSYTFLGFSGVTPDNGNGDDAGDVGGAPTEEPAAEVTFTGKLMQSDNADRGNYVIVSGATKVYLKTVRDYSAWVNENVTLTAEGTLNSFSGAVLNKAS